MKKIILFAVSCFAVLLAGCLPQQQLTGRVMDASGPVPGAAVLAMVWVEDAGKAFPAPVVTPLSQEQVTTLYEIDKAHRGLPAAYARAFTDKDGFFTLDKLNFSSETGKAVKAMSRPEITRITLVAFQRGHIKHAATVFPKGLPKELPPAVIILPRPEGWKQLALDNYFRMLKQPEYENGYSKDYGATKEEKKWFLDYMSSNLNEAYQASNIKGDKQWEKDCGRDFSDIMVSTAGIQRNPAHERCNELLHQAGVLRNWEESWLAHSLAIKTEPAPAVKAIGEALEALGPEYAEVRQYEAQIMEGAKEAGELDSKNEAGGNQRNGLSEENPVSAIAQRLYNTGDKAGAYKALGHSLYNGLPVNLKRQAETAMLPATAIPGITGAAAGFYLLMNKPLTAQLPNSDGNHKDKPGYKVDTSTEAITRKDTIAKKVKLGDDEVDVEKVYARYYVGLDIGRKTQRETFGDHDAERTIDKKIFGHPNAGYFGKVENQFVTPVCDNCEGYDEEIAKLELYTTDGTLRLKKDFKNERIKRLNVLKNGMFIADIEPGSDAPEQNNKYEIYDMEGKLIYLSTSVTQSISSSNGDFNLFLEKVGDGTLIRKVDITGQNKILAHVNEELPNIYISDNGKGFVVATSWEGDRNSPTGSKYWFKRIVFFLSDNNMWSKTLEAEGFTGTAVSKSAAYVIVNYQVGVSCREIVPVDGEKYQACDNGVEMFRVLDTQSQKVVYDGVKDDMLISKYMDESIKTPKDSIKAVVAPEGLVSNSAAISSMDADFIKIGEDKIMRSALCQGSDGVVIESRETKEGINPDGQAIHKRIERKAYGCAGSDYIVRTYSALSGLGDEEPGSYEKSFFELFDKNGNKVFERELGNRNIEQIWLFSNGTSVLYSHENPSLGVDIRRYQIYDNRGKELREIADTYSTQSWEMEEYKIPDGMYIMRFIMSPRADAGLLVVKVSDTTKKILGMNMNGSLSQIASYDVAGLAVQFSKWPNVFLVFATKTLDKLASSGKKYLLQTIDLYRDNKLVWKTSIEAESFGMNNRGFSKTGRYLFVEYWSDIVIRGVTYMKFAERIKVIRQSDGKLVFDGEKTAGKVKEYQEEVAAE